MIISNIFKNKSKDTVISGYILSGLVVLLLVNSLINDEWGILIAAVPIVAIILICGLLAVFFAIRWIFSKLLPAKISDYLITLFLAIIVIGWNFYENDYLRTQVALRTKNPAVCKSDECIMKFFDMTNRKDAKLCDLMGGGVERDGCYLAVAQETVNYGLCEKLSTGWSDMPGDCKRGLDAIGNEMALRAEGWLNGTFLVEAGTRVLVVSIKGYTFDGSAWVKILDGKYSGKEGQVSLSAIVAPEFNH